MHQSRPSHAEDVDRPILTESDLRAFLDDWSAEPVEIDASEPGRVRVSIRFRGEDHPQDEEVLADIKKDMAPRTALGILWSITLAGSEGPYR